MYMAVDNLFIDSQHSHTAIEPSSPSLKCHIPLAPLLKIPGKVELTASSTALSNPSAFVLPPSAEGITGAEVHPPTIPPPVPFSPNPMHFHHPFPEGNTGPKQHQPVIPPPTPLSLNPVCILPTPSPIHSISRYVLQRSLHYLWCALSS